MKKVLSFILETIITIAIIAVLMWLSKVIFEAVYYSDMPMWIKYILLKG